MLSGVSDIGDMFIRLSIFLVLGIDRFRLRQGNEAYLVKPRASYTHTS